MSERDFIRYLAEDEGYHRIKDTAYISEDSGNADINRAIRRGFDRNTMTGSNSGKAKAPRKIKGGV